jgi:hypothetical protein
MTIGLVSTVTTIILYPIEHIIGVDSRDGWGWGVANRR